jgi:hypothetical protein
MIIITTKLEYEKATPLDQLAEVALSQLTILLEAAQPSS